MKKYIVILSLFLLAPIVFGQGQFGQRNTTVTTYTSAGSPFNTNNNDRVVIFIFRSSYTGNVGNSAFTSSDVPLRIEAPSGDTLRAIPFTCTAGTVVVVEVR
jgi:hypothetical protein